MVCEAVQLEVCWEANLLACRLVSLCEAHVASHPQHHALGSEWDALLLDHQGTAETRLQASQTCPW